MATLSLTVASCDFCSSDRRFASAFLQIPLALIIVVAMKRTPLVLAVSFPLLGWIRDFHPLETCAARRTTKAAHLRFGEGLLLCLQQYSILFFTCKLRKIPAVMCCQIPYQNYDCRRSYHRRNRTKMTVQNHTDDCSYD